jgi:divinyl chlorophyllide a 8-vinyl-reductase
MTGMGTSDRRRNVAVFGASGTIGRAVVKRLVREGHSVTAVVRAGSEHTLAEFEQATIIAVDVGDPAELAQRVFGGGSYDSVISCLASRSGAPKDAWAIDYQANANLLTAAKQAGVAQFVLLSAICVQKPLLAFQHAKLEFEAALQKSGLTWSIVRPTAFFKSLSGQVERVRQGKPFLIFGDGALTRCKPISDRDLAAYIVGCLDQSERHNTVLPIGGPGPAITLRQQGEMLFELTGEEPRFQSVPLAFFKLASRLLSVGAGVFGWFAEKAEYARIAHYYASESMLVLDPDSGEYSAELTPEFGSDTLRDHYASMLEAGLPDAASPATPAAG